MKTILLTLLLLGTGLPTIRSEPTSSSTNYDLLWSPLGLGGGQIGNGSNITAQVSVGEATSGQVSDVTSGGAQNKPHYIGQLYDVTSLVLSSTPPTVDEGGTRQLGTAQLLDDSTTIALAAGSIAWSVPVGPLTIDANGLASGSSVYEDTAAVAQGEYAGASGILDLTVLDILPDNFGSYAGDGLDDDWQVGFFGVDNPDAAPGEDPDEDEQDNAFEHLAKADPTDSTSLFETHMEPVSGQPSHRRIVFKPFFLERSYTLRSTVALGVVDFADVPDTSSSNSGDGGEGEITDRAAVEIRKFYEIEISD